MDQIYPIHQFAETAAAQVPGLCGHDCELIVVQEPTVCKVSIGKEKDRKPVDPPPIVQLKVSPISDPNQNYLQSSHFFLTCNLYGYKGPALAGTVVSSLHRLKDLDNKEGAFFVFGDVSIKVEGLYRLQFDLYEMQGGDHCVHICSTISQQFPVVSSKNFHGMPESTGLTRTFSEQGVRLRLRKEPRSLLKPKGPATDDYKPRHYRTNIYTQNSQNETLPSPVSPVGSTYSAGLSLDPHEHQLISSSVRPTKQLGRSYSYHSEQTHSVSSDFDGRQAKRSRTGSEHSPQIYGTQNQPLDASQYQAMASFSPSPMPGFTPLSHYAGGPYVSQSIRDNYLPQRGVGGRSLSYSDAIGHMSSDNNMRYATQTHPIQNPSSYMGSMLHGRQQPETDYALGNFVSRTYVPQGMGTVPMLATDWRATSEAVYQTIPTSSLSERQIYALFPNQNPNISSG